MNTITITKEDFNEAVGKAADEFTDISIEHADNITDSITVFMMGLQNVAFATLLEKHLFGEEPIKEDITNFN